MVFMSYLVVVSQVKEQLVPILQNYDTKAQVIMCKIHIRRSTTKIKIQCRSFSV